MTVDENDNAPYPTLDTKVCCIYSSDASDIALCPLEVHCHSWAPHLATFLVDGTIDGNRDGNCEQSCNFGTVKLVLILNSIFVVIYQYNLIFITQYYSTVRNDTDGQESVSGRLDFSGLQQPDSSSIEIIAVPV